MIFCFWPGDCLRRRYTRLITLCLSEAIVPGGLKTDKFVTLPGSRTGSGNKETQT